MRKALTRRSPDSAGARIGARALLLLGAVVLIGLCIAPRWAAAQLGPCFGDCNDDGSVRVDELIRGVNIVLAIAPLDGCSRLDADGDGVVTVAELVRAVSAALDGCVRVEPTPIATPPSTFTETPTAPPTETPTESPMPTATATRRPNIILVNLDDTRADGVDRMPTLLSRIAGQGLRYDNVFVTNASCGPSRASILSGLYSFHHGTRSVSGPLGGADTFRLTGSDQHTVAVWLHDAGYRTGLFGKYINSYMGSEETAGPDGTFYIPPGWDRWQAFVSPEHYGGIHGNTYTLVDENGFRAVYGDHQTDAQYSTDVTAAAVRAFVEDAVQADRPFFAVWTPYASHGETPGIYPAPADRHFGFFQALTAFRPPSWDEEDVSDKPRWLRARPSNDIMIGVTDVARQRAYESLLAVDEQLGLILDQLTALGIDDNTVVIVTSDNGVGWGEHQIWAQRKGCPYEECLRVPLMIRDPRFALQPGSREEPVLNIDVPVTIADLAGVPVSLAVDGQSFADWIGTPTPRADFLIENVREVRSDVIGYARQPTDGDRVRLFYGDPFAHPRASALFEFDAGDGVSGDAIPVAIGGDDDSSMANLAVAVQANVPQSDYLLDTAHNGLTAGDHSPQQNGVYWWVEVDQGGIFDPNYVTPDYFGVRDVANGYTYVEYETGERELYDLTADPDQLDNRADDPAFAALRAQYADRLQQLLGQAPR